MAKISSTGEVTGGALPAAEAVLPAGPEREPSAPAKAAVPVPVADQVSAGVAQAETVTIAGQKAGADAPVPPELPVPAAKPAARAPAPPPKKVAGG